MADSSVMTNEIGSGESVIRAKWGTALEAGFQVVPNVLFRAQSALGLDTTDVVVLLNIMAHWWNKTDRPYIAANSIAKRIQKSTRTVERRLKKLEELGFLKRSEPILVADKLYRREYDLEPLVEKLEHATLGALRLREKWVDEKFERSEGAGRSS